MASPPFLASINGKWHTGDSDVVTASELEAFFAYYEVNTADAMNLCIAYGTITHSFPLSWNVSTLLLPGVATLPSGIFRGMVSLRELSLGKELTAIPSEMCFGCNNLEIVAMAQTTIVIGDRAFERCVSLKSITIPSNVQQMGLGVFSGCTGLLSIRFSNKLLEINDWMCEGCINLQFVTLSVLCRTIGIGAFMDCKALKYIVIPEFVTTICESAFQQCTSLARLYGIHGVTLFGERSLHGSGIESLVVQGAHDVTFGYCAFNSCKALTSVTVSGMENVTVGPFAFGASGVKNLTIESSSAELREGAFCMNTHLAFVQMPVNTRLFGIVFLGANFIQWLLLHGTQLNSSADDRLAQQKNWGAWFKPNPEPRDDTWTEFDDDEKQEASLNGLDNPDFSLWTEDPGAFTALNEPFEARAADAMQRAAPEAKTWAAVQLWVWWSPPTGAGYTNRMGVCKDARKPGKCRRLVMFFATIAATHGAAAGAYALLPPPLWLIIFSFLKHDQTPYCVAAVAAADAAAASAAAPPDSASESDSEYGSSDDEA